MLAGLEADTTGGSTLALGRYEDALRVDSGNPYAYLALARYHADGLDPEEATPFLDQAEALTSTAPCPATRSAATSSSRSGAAAGAFRCGFGRAR